MDCSQIDTADKTVGKTEAGISSDPPMLLATPER